MRRPHPNIGQQHYDRRVWESSHPATPGKADKLRIVMNLNADLLRVISLCDDVVYIVPLYLYLYFEQLSVHLSRRQDGELAKMAQYSF